MKRILISILALNFLLLLSCNTPQGMFRDSSSQELTGSHIILVAQPPLSLVDLLIQVPGVQANRDFDQVSVTIRGGAPLFYIDGMRIGQNYQKVVELINVFDIKTVEVIKDPSESAIYGPGSGNGVVLINTLDGSVPEEEIQ